MTKSATAINYEIRPCKFVERRMLLASLARIMGAIRKGQDYQYIGFGGCSFTDFKLFHRELQINKMSSIEKDSYTDTKLELNKPFQCINIVRGTSYEVLPHLNLKIPSIVWLDYDGVLQTYMFNDIGTIISNIPTGSVLIISCNRELKVGNYKEIFEEKQIETGNQKEPLSEKELRVVFDDLVPFDIPSNACSPENSNNTIKMMFDKKIRSVINDRNNIKNEDINFRLLYNIKYQENRGAPMYTYGGIVYDHSNNIDNVYLEDFDFIAKNPSDPPYKIDVPILTHREVLALNQILFDDEKETDFVSKGILTKEELLKYKKIYKYCPSFHDVRL